MASLFYYQITSKLPLASRVSLHMRRRMFDTFIRCMQPTAQERILDLGVTCDERQQESNYFEQYYPHRQNLVCAGVEDASHLEQKYPGVQFIRVQPHQELPFPDRHFDVAFSNAVIEHVGSRHEQRSFVNEILRVANRFFITTPNRWFPVEMHTGLPFLHYLPPRIYRGILRRVGLSYYADEENLNLLTRRQFRALFPAGASVQVHAVSLLGWPSNLIAFGQSPRRNDPELTPARPEVQAWSPV